MCLRSAVLFATSRLGFSSMGEKQRSNMEVHTIARRHADFLSHLVVLVLDMSLTFSLPFQVSGAAPGSDDLFVSEVARRDRLFGTGRQQSYVGGRGARLKQTRGGNLGRVRSIKQF